MKGVGRSRRPRRQGPPADHTYSSRGAAPSPLPLTVPGDGAAPLEAASSPLPLSLPGDTWRIDILAPHADPSDDSIQASDVLLADDCAVHTEDAPPVEVLPAKPIRKRKRRRRNEYDFGPKRKRRKKKSQTKSDLKDSNPSSDPDSLRNVKELYASSEEKKWKDSLFGENDSIPKRGPRPPKPGDMAYRPTGCCLAQTTCCQFFKVRKSSENSERTFRRKNGLWRKGDRCSQRLVAKNFKFPFHNLPFECKMKIFNFLDPVSKGVAARVCRDWRGFVRDPDAWGHIDLDFLSSGLTCQITGTGGARKGAVRARYDVVKARTGSFVTFMSRVKPRLRSLAFQFDIGNYMDNWYSHIEALLRDCEMKRLATVDIDWQTTPCKPSCLETYCCIFNKARVLFKLHLYRVHVFHRMLEVLTKCTTHVYRISMPFDWSPRSVLLISRWRSLTSVQLLPYLSMRGMDQSVLDAFLRSHPMLQHLQLADCVPLYTNTDLFNMCHEVLETLDMSATKGFYLKHIEMPQLREIKLSQHPWTGALVSTDNQAFVPCIYNLMVKGLPNLEVMNKHHLAAYWKDFAYDELQLVLKKVCVCSRHFVLPDSVDN